MWTLFISLIFEFRPPARPSNYSYSSTSTKQTTSPIILSTNDNPPKQQPTPHPKKISIPQRPSCQAHSPAERNCRAGASKNVGPRAPIHRPRRIATGSGRWRIDFPARLRQAEGRCGLCVSARELGVAPEKNERRGESLETAEGRTRRRTKPGEPAGRADPGKKCRDGRRSGSLPPHDLGGAPESARSRA